MKKSIACVVCLVLASACSSDTHNAPPTPQSAAPSIIDNEDLSLGLRGIDIDRNGIRDDIDRLIAKNYSGTTETKKAVEQEARALQSFMEATTREQALAAGNQNYRAWLCLEKMLVPPGSTNIDLAITASRQVEALTANTKQRFDKYWDSNRLASGGYFIEPSEPVCD